MFCALKVYVEGLADLEGIVEWYDLERVSEKKIQKTYSKMDVVR